MNERHEEPDHHEPEREPSRKPRVWVGSLADYNAGTLHGEWIDAAVDDDELLSSVQNMLATSEEPGAEEWGIFDYDDFGAYRVEEHDYLRSVAAIARGIVRHGEAFSVWADLHDGDPDMLAEFEEAYIGTYPSAEAWAEGELAGLDQLLDEHAPEALRAYVTTDYQQWARDADLEGSVYVVHRVRGPVLVFWT